MNFVPERETFTSVPVWVRLYSLPLDYWQTELLAAISNKLGRFIKASEATRSGKYTSFARICVEMDLSGALPDEVILEVFDEEWVQTVDYEHIPFRCRRCHEHGHLLRDCPLSKAENKNKNNTMKDTDSSHRVVHKGKSGKKGPKQHQAGGQKDNQNQYQVLEVDDETMVEDQVMKEGYEKMEKEEDNDLTQENEKQKGK